MVLFSSLSVAILGFMPRIARGWLGASMLAPSARQLILGMKPRMTAWMERAAQNNGAPA